MKTHVLSLLAAVAFVSPAARADLAPSWQALADARARDALAGFRSTDPTSASSREARFGEAMALLILQPKTAGNVEAARRICETLVEQTPADPWALQARYLLGRIAEFHTVPTDLAAAQRHYQILVAGHVSEEIAQNALVRLAMLQLYEAVPADELKRRFSSLEAQTHLLTFAPARRDFHLVMADASTCLPLAKEAALRHSLAAFEAGVAQSMRRASVVLRIAELARELGQRELAIRFYRLFLEPPRFDNRNQLARERLAALEKGDTP